MTDSFHSPATQAEMRWFENEHQVALPEDFKQMYFIHNGQKHLESSIGPFYGLEMISLERIHCIVNGYGDRSVHLEESRSSAIRGQIKNYSFRPNWIPFAHDWGGNYLGIDLDPDYAGREGQVINFGRDEYVRYVLGNSISEFLIWYMRELESGNYIITRDHPDIDVDFNTKNPKKEHFLDSIVHMFPRDGENV